MATLNYAIHLNGSNEHWTLADDAELDYAGGDAFTFGLWLKPDWDYLTVGAALDKYIFSRNGTHALYADQSREGKLNYYFESADGAVTWETSLLLLPDRANFIMLTGAESGGDTTLCLYHQGVLHDTTVLSSHAMPADTNTALYVGVDYGTTTNKYFKGSMTGWFHDNDAALTAANALTLWNNGAYDIDTTEALSMDSSIGFEENTGATFDNALHALWDGAGQNTPTWVNRLDPTSAAAEQNQAQTINLDFTGVGQNTHKTLIVDNIKWHGDSIADADQLELTEWDGSRVIRHFAEADDVGLNRRLYGQIVRGLKVKTMDHGVIMVTVR